MMKTALTRIAKISAPLILVALPFAFASVVSGVTTVALISLAAVVFALACYYFGLHRIDFDEKSVAQRMIIVALLVLTLLFSFFVCAISIEDAWLIKYPFEKSVDEYGCYPQMFDAFKKGRLDIDTDYDLTVLESLENPYDPMQRYAATGEKNGVIWDRAYFENKLFSYFGVAPVLLVYFPIYFLTGSIPSDALTAAIITAVSAIALMLLLIELIRHSGERVPFLLLFFGCVTLPCGALLWSSLTCANFYHIALLSGICSTSCFLLFLLKAYHTDGPLRKLLLVLSGISLACIAASRPNMLIYFIVAIPLIISACKKKSKQLKSLWLDVLAFSVPIVVLGSLIALYNLLRFGSIFEFGATYQLTITDTSNYSLSLAMLLPAIYHYFLHPPAFDRIFPFLHPVGRTYKSYGSAKYVYLDKSLGAIFLPTTLGVLLTPFVLKTKREKSTAYLAIFAVLAIAWFDMCFGGVHLRYQADIMFVLTLLGIYLLLRLVAQSQKGSLSRAYFFGIVLMLFVTTFLVEIPLCIDNERDMILKYHPEIIRFFL